MGMGLSEAVATMPELSDAFGTVMRVSVTSVSRDAVSGTATPRRVAVINAAGLTNLGDDAIAAAVLADVHTTFPDARLFVTGAAASNGVAHLERIAFHDRSIAEAIAESDLVVIGGGGLFYDHDACLTPASFERGDFFHLYPYVRAALVAQAEAVPVCLYAVGVGPLVTPGGRQLALRAAAAATQVTVRDKASALELRRIGLEAPVPEVTADPAISLPPAEGRWPERPAGPLIGFVARPWLRGQPTGGTASGRAFFDRYVDCLAAAADAAWEVFGATPVFLGAQTRGDDDLAVARCVVARMRHSDRAFIHAAIRRFEDLQTVLASLDALMSTRLHPLLLASTAKVPGAGIVVAGAKVGAFLAAIGLPELAVSGWLGDPRALIDRMELLFTDGQSIRGRLAEGVASQQRAAARNRVVLSEVLAAAHVQ